MSQGKYSPNLPQGFNFILNCFGKVPAPWTKELEASGVKYDEKTMFGNYDDQGFDRYGYSAFDSNGNYAGIGDGVDRNGLTEHDYLVMDSDEYAEYF